MREDGPLDRANIRRSDSISIRLCLFFQVAKARNPVSRDIGRRVSLLVAREQISANKLLIAS